jgi:hypothetical protein
MMHRLELENERSHQTKSSLIRYFRYAFGDVGAGGGRDLLGVFATRDVVKGATLLVDSSKTWVKVENDWRQAISC